MVWKESGQSVTIYAKWIAQVTFDLNGGNGSGDYSQQNILVYGSNTATKPANDPAKTNTVFRHWAVNGGDLNTPYNFSAPVTQDIELIAVYTNLYSVTYNPGTHGAWTQAVHSSIPENASRPAEPNNYDQSNNAGYEFDTWSPALQNTVTSNVEYIAQWRPKTYTITYDGNGATSVAMSAQTATYDQTLTLNPNTFVKSGYTFAGWSSNGADNSVEYANGYSFNPWTLTNNLTLTAVWTPKTYTVRFNTGTVTDGGTYQGYWWSDAASDFSLTTGTKTYTIPPVTNVKWDDILTIPPRWLYIDAPGYYFSHWEVTENEKNANPISNGTNMKYGDLANSDTNPMYITITAIWDQYRYHVYLDYNDGVTEDIINVADPADPVTVLPLPNRVGYTFNNWKNTVYNESSPGSNALYSAGASPTYATLANAFYVANNNTYPETVTLTAQWTANTNTPYKVEHWVMDTSGNYVKDGADDNLTGTTNAILTLANLKRSSLEVPNGIVYKEAKVGGGAVTTANILADGSLVVKLYYERKQYTLTVSAGTGVATTTGSGLKYYGESISPGATAKTGYTAPFGYSPNPATMPANSLTITATATPEVYGIKYFNGATELTTLSPNTYTYGVSTPLPALPAKIGYTPSGWYEHSDFSGAAVTTIGASETGNKTFYVKYTANSNTVYNVEHYVMNTSGVYVLAYDSRLTGTTGALLTLADLKHSSLEVTNGITYKEATVDGSLATTATILADGSLVVKLYYDRKQYALTVTAGTGVTATTGSGTYYYGATISYSGDGLATGYKLPYSYSSTLGSMPADNLTITVTATLELYSIRYFDDATELTMLSPNGYTYGAGATLPALPRKNGYTASGWYEDSNFSGAVITSVGASETGAKTFYIQYTAKSTDPADPNCWRHPYERRIRGQVTDVDTIMPLDTVVITSLDSVTLERQPSVVYDHTVVTFLTDSFYHGSRYRNAQIFSDTTRIRHQVEFWASDDHTHDSQLELVSEIQMNTKEYAGIYTRHLHLEPIGACNQPFSELWPQDPSVDVITSSRLGGFGTIYSDVYVELEGALAPGYESLREKGAGYELQAGWMDIQQLRLDQGAEIRFSIGDLDGFMDRENEEHLLADLLYVTDLIARGTVNVVIEKRDGENCIPGCYPIIKYENAAPGMLNLLTLKTKEINGQPLALDFNTQPGTVLLCVGSPGDPRVQREIRIPSVAGATTWPPAGTHYTEWGKDFAFTIQFDGKPLTVKTSRYFDGLQEELPGTLNANGEYQYLIRAVKTQPIYIYIGPEAVANETLSGPDVWAHGNMLYIRVAHETTANIYSIAGQLVKILKLGEGVTAIPLGRGVYIVTLKDNVIHKVIIR
ncbi:MAG: InlB B-repeat-containing protein [Tannerella sp.]|nr:InlB B-repeat-containing protein [Tannerella sp.]